MGGGVGGLTIEKKREAGGRKEMEAFALRLWGKKRAVGTES